LSKGKEDGEESIGECRCGDETEGGGEGGQDGSEWKSKGKKSNRKRPKTIGTKKPTLDSFHDPALSPALHSYINK
jgi:hypothetical protein